MSNHTLHAQVETEIASARLRISDDDSYRGLMHRCSEYPRFSPAFQMAQRWGRLMQVRLATQPELMAEFGRRALEHASIVHTQHDIDHPRGLSRRFTHPQYAFPDISRRTVTRDQLRQAILKTAADANTGPDGRETLDQHGMVQAAVFLQTFWKHGKGLGEVMDEYIAVARQKDGAGLLRLPRIGSHNLTKLAA